MYETQFCTPEDCGHDDMGFMTLSTSAEQRFRQKKYATNIIIFQKVIFLSIKKRNFSCLENGIFSSLKFSQRPPEGGTTNGGVFSRISDGSDLSVRTERHGPVFTKTA